jgi:hypothetical protein
MFDRSDLRAAVEAGALTPDAATRFEAFLKTRSDPDRMLDPENLRFLTNFNDVFLTIGLVILISGVGAASGMIFGSQVTSPAGAILIVGPVLAISWLLAEYFAGRRRLLLPSMALSVAICLSAAVIGSALLTPNGDKPFDRDWGDSLASVGYAGLGAAAVAALAVHLRFRLAFALGLFALALAGIAYAALAHMGQGGAVIGGVAALVIGLATLVAAIWFDIRDPGRASVNSDRAFWLHTAAAPQIMLGVGTLVNGNGFGDMGASDALVMLAILLVFGVLSLGLNRRSLIVSGLITFIAVIGTLVSQIGADGASAFMLTALVVGGVIVLLGGGWRTARRMLLGVLPKGGIFGRIFPPEPDLVRPELNPVQPPA